MDSQVRAQHRDGGQGTGKDLKKQSTQAETVMREILRGLFQSEGTGADFDGCAVDLEMASRS